MSQYQTKQRKTLVDFLAMHPDESMSAKTLAAHLEPEGISLSAVYRNLNSLELSGKVRRCNTGDGREALYQYADAECCREWLHMACVHCGKTFHLAREATERLAAQMAESQFVLDTKTTVLYGACGGCRRKG